MLDVWQTERRKASRFEEGASLSLRFSLWPRVGGLSAWRSAQARAEALRRGARERRRERERTEKRKKRKSETEKARERVRKQKIETLHLLLYFFFPLALSRPPPLSAFPPLSPLLSIRPFAHEAPSEAKTEVQRAYSSACREEENAASSLSARQASVDESSRRASERSIETFSV